MAGGCIEGVVLRCLEVALRVSWGCLEAVKQVSEMYQSGVLPVFFCI